MRIGLITIFITAIVALFIGLFTYFLLMVTVLPSAVSYIENVLPWIDTPAEIFPIFDSVKQTTSNLIYIFPVALIIGMIIFVITRSAQSEEDVIPV